MNTSSPLRRQQSGVALIAALIILLVMTLIGVSGMDETILEDRMSLNFRDRAVADAAAESSVRMAETWLGRTGSRPDAWTSTDCTAGPPLCGSGEDFIVWDEGQLFSGSQTVADLEWSDFSTNGVAYQGSGTTASSLSGVHDAPRGLLEFRDFNPSDSQGRVVQMDSNKASLGIGPYYYNIYGAGVGFRQDTQAVVESTYVRWF